MIYYKVWFINHDNVLCDIVGCNTGEQATNTVMRLKAMWHAVITKEPAHNVLMDTRGDFDKEKRNGSS